MTPAEIIKLLELARSYSPSLPLSEGTPAAWAYALADVGYADAVAVVHEHFANGGPWIGVADVRRRVATRHGLLPPDPDTAFAQAVAFNRWLSRRRGPEPPVHPAALEAARLVGWHAFDGPDGGHRRFHGAYRPIADRFTQEALTGNLAKLAAAVDAPKALPAGTGVVPPEEPESDVNEHRVADVRAAVARVSAARALQPVRPDYAPPTDVEKRRWSDALSEWAEQNGQPINQEEAS